MNSRNDTLRAEAVSNLAEKLKSGQQVGRCTVQDLLDCELDDPKTCFALSATLGDLLMAESGERAAKADTVVDGLVKRYLASPTGEELVRQEIADIVHAMEVEA